MLLKAEIPSKGIFPMMAINVSRCFQQTVISLDWIVRGVLILSLLYSYGLCRQTVLFPYPDITICSHEVLSDFPTVYGHRVAQDQTVVSVPVIPTTTPSGIGSYLGGNNSGVDNQSIAPDNRSGYDFDNGQDHDNGIVDDPGGDLGDAGGDSGGSS